VTPPLWRNRDFNLLWGGQVVSTLGSEVSGLAFPLLVLALTGSPSQAGLVGFARGLPYLLLYLPAGALVDRWNRKRVMLVADAGRAAALGSVALWVALGRPPVAWLAVASFVEGALFVFFQLAESAALPQIVPKAQLPQAIAQNQARTQGVHVAGAPLGGALFGVSRVLPFVVDAVSYAASFVSLLFIRSRFQEERAPRSTRLRADIGEGMRWLWSHPFLRTTTLLVAGTNFVHQGLFAIVLIVRARELGASPALIGVMLSFAGAAAILGSLAAPWVQRRLPPSLVVLGSLWLWVPQTAVLALIPQPIALGAVAGAAVVVGPMFNVVVGSYRYALVPDRLLGRVQSASLVVSWGAIPLGALFAGLAVDALGARLTFLVLAAILLVLALAGTASAAVRTVPRPEELAPAA